MPFEQEGNNSVLCWPVRCTGCERKGGLSAPDFSLSPGSVAGRLVDFQLLTARSVTSWRFRQAGGMEEYMSASEREARPTQ